MDKLQDILNRAHIDPSRPMVVEQKLGVGQYGQVFRIKTEDQRVAVKVFTDVAFDPGHPELLPYAICNELNTMKSVHHPNVMGILKELDWRGRRGFPSVYMIFMELMEGGDLVHAIYSKTEPFTPLKAVIFTLQLLQGLHHLHDVCAIAHRDLKPGNILVNGRNLKISDFGASREANAVLSLDAYTSGGACTMWYRSPEHALEYPELPFSLDIWSFGCIVWEMAFQWPLFYCKNSDEVSMLMNVFNLLGTPNEDTWPGISSAPHYQECFPKFPQAYIEHRFDTQNMDPYMLFIIIHSVCMYPGDRLPILDQYMAVKDAISKPTDEERLNIFRSLYDTRSAKRVEQAKLAAERAEQAMQAP